MRVSELIEALNRVPPDHHVIIRCGIGLLRQESVSFSLSAQNPDDGFAIDVYRIQTGTGGHFSSILGKKINEWVPNKV